MKVNVNVVKHDNTNSNYSVDYPQAYVNKIMSEENDKDIDARRVKEIYVSGSLVAELQSGRLEPVKWKPAVNASKKAEVITIEIPGTEYWVSTSTAGNTMITYVSESIADGTPVLIEEDEDLPF